MPTEYEIYFEQYPWGKARSTSTNDLQMAFDIAETQVSIDQYVTITDLTTKQVLLDTRQLVADLGSAYRNAIRGICDSLKRDPYAEVA